MRCVSSLLFRHLVRRDVGLTCAPLFGSGRFLLQKRLVVRQYKYVLYLQNMTYVLCFVLFCER